MLEKDKIAIQEIEGTAGFRVIMNLVEQKMKKVDSVREIKRDGLVAEQALARQLTYEVLEEFFSDLKIYQTPLKQSNNTYE